MRTPRSTRLVAVALAATTVGACGSAANHVSARPAPPKLALAASAATVTDSAASAAAPSDKRVAGPALYPQQATTYVLDGALADLGAKATVRKLVGHVVTAAEVTRIGEALGMHGTPTQGPETIYSLTDGDAHLTVQSIGGATLVDFSHYSDVVDGGGTASSPGSAGTGIATDTPLPIDKPLPAEPPIVVPPPTLTAPTTPPPVEVPSAADAEKIAQSLLDELGVLSGQEWKHEVIDTEGVAVSCASDGPCEPPAPATVTQRTISYELLVDGAPVPGVNWWVTIGDHGRVESLSGTWARPEDAGSYALQSTKAVFEDLQAGRAQYVGGVQALMAGDVAEIKREAVPGDVPGVAPIEDPGAGTGAVAPDPTPDTLPNLVVHITGVSLGAARWEGAADGSGLSYLVPTYRFHATVDGNPPYDLELLALDPAGFTIVSTPPPATPPHPTPGGPKTGIEPQPAPAREPAPVPPEAATLPAEGG